jgi:hypothetical protein
MSCDHSSQEQPKAETSGYVQVQPNQQTGGITGGVFGVCPTCNRCPTCGQYRYYYPYYQPNVTYNLCGGGEGYSGYRQ